MMTHVVCRNCHWRGRVDLARTKNKWSKLHRFLGIRFLMAKASPEGDKGKPATGVPCPKCKQHKLKRREIE